MKVQKKQIVWLLVLIGVFTIYHFIKVLDLEKKRIMLLMEILKDEPNQKSYCFQPILEGYRDIGSTTIAYHDILNTISSDINNIYSLKKLKQIEEILPVFALFGLHNASYHLTERNKSIIRQLEEYYPNGYYRSMPFISPITQIYINTIRHSDLTSSKTLFSDGEKVLLPQFNHCLFETMVDIFKKNKVNLDSIEVYHEVSDNLYATKNKKLMNDGFFFFSVSGLPTGGFDAIERAFRIFFHHRSHENVMDLRTNSYDDIRTNCMRDEIMLHRSKLCENVVSILKKKPKLRHLKVYHVKNSQNLMIEVAPLFRAGSSEQIPEDPRWTQIILGFLGGLVNHYAYLENENVFTISRQSFGFLQPTLAQCASAIRISMGVQPLSHAKILAEAILAVDGVIESYKNTYLIKSPNAVLISDIAGNTVNLKDLGNTRNNIRYIKAIMTKQCVNLPFLLSQKVPPTNSNYYMKAMKREENEFLFNYSIPFLQDLLNHQIGDKLYLWKSFLIYINKLVISRIRLENNRLSFSPKVLPLSLRSLAESNIFGIIAGNAKCREDFMDSNVGNIPLESEDTAIVKLLLTNMLEYIRDRLKHMKQNHLKLSKFLPNTLEFVEKKLKLCEGSVERLLQNYHTYKSSCFYSQAISLIESILEYLSIANGLCFLVEEDTSCPNNWILQSDDITNAVFLFGSGEQACTSCILWLLSNYSTTNLITDISSYYEIVFFRNFAKDLFTSRVKKDGITIYYLDPCPTITSFSLYNEFCQHNTLKKVNEILSIQDGSDIALIYDITGITETKARETIEKWRHSKNKVKYFILVNSGNKNCQLGFDRYQFGYANILYKNSETPVVDFKMLTEISNESGSRFFRYLLKELERMQGGFIVIQKP